jgi:hypothetical protein
MGGRSGRCRRLVGLARACEWTRGCTRDCTLNCIRKGEFACPYTDDCACKRQNAPLRPCGVKTRHPPVA